MYSVTQWTLLVSAGLLTLISCATAQSPQASAGKEMTFFVTSVGPGKGADLGGLEGADQHCQSLAKAAGAGNHTWHAYLSTQASALSDPKAEHARDRIGAGPWYNAKGVRDERNHGIPMDHATMTIGCNTLDIAIGARLCLEQLRLDGTHRGCPQVRTSAAWRRCTAPVEARRNDVFGAPSGPKVAS